MDIFMIIYIDIFEHKYIYIHTYIPYIYSLLVFPIGYSLLAISLLPICFGDGPGPAATARRRRKPRAGGPAASAVAQSQQGCKQQHDCV